MVYLEKIILPHRKVLLSLSLSPQEPDIFDYLYIVYDVSFNVDLLIGFNTMCKYDISLFLAINEIAQGDTYIPTALSSDTSSLAGVVTSVATLPSTSDQMLSTRDSCVMSSNLPVLQPYS